MLKGKKFAYIAVLMALIMLSALVLNACKSGKKGSIYNKADMTALSEKFESYVIDVDIAGIINSTSTDNTVQNVSLARPLASGTAGYMPLAEKTENNTTATDYEGLFGDLQNIQDNADFMSQKMQTLIKSLLASFPEQNQWIAYTSDAAFQKKDNSNGNISISKLTVNGGVTEYFETSTNGSMTGDVRVCYVKITEVAGSNEPIVEFQSSVADKGEMYMYYVPKEEVKIIIADDRDYTNIKLYQHCKIVEVNGISNFYYTSQTSHNKQYITGNLQDGFVESKTIVSQEMAFYKDGYKLIWVNESNDLYLNLEATRLEKEFEDTETQLVQVGESGEYGQRYQNIQGTLTSLQYCSNPEEIMWFGESDGAIRYDFQPNEAVINISLIGNSALGYIGNFMTTDPASLDSRFADIYDEYSEEVIEALFSETDYNIYKEKLAYGLGTVIKQDVEAALNTPTASLRYTNQQALGMVNALTAEDIHFLYRTEGNTLEANYQDLKIIIFSTDEWGMVSAVSSAVVSADNDATITHTNDFNGFDTRNKQWQVVYALESDGEYFEIATGNKLLSSSGDNRIRSEVESTVTFTVQGMLKQLDNAGQLKDGRFNLKAYYKANDDKVVAAESITSIHLLNHSVSIAIEPEKEPIYIYFTYEANDGSHYNIAAHRSNANPNDYDTTAYFLISKVS